MFLEVLIAGGVVAAGAMALRALRNRVEARTSAEPRDKVGPAPMPGSEPERVPTDPGPVRDPLPRGLRTGDVLLHGDSEIWLAGEVYLDEEGFVAALFPTPGSRYADWVAQLDSAGDEIVFLHETGDVPDGEVPTELPLDGLRLRLQRRGVAQVVSGGEHLPRTAKRCRYGILGGGARVLVVVDFDGVGRLALKGERVPERMYDLLPGGD